jgi:hypothetical protein
MVILTVICILNRLSDRDFSCSFDNWKIRWTHCAAKGGNMLKGKTCTKNKMFIKFFFPSAYIFTWFSCQIVQFRGDCLLLHNTNSF